MNIVEISNLNLIIPFTLDQALPVQLKIYNHLGQIVSNFEFRISNLGENKAVWDASQNSSGVYFIRLEMLQRASGSRRMQHSATRKVIY